jgi:hypothetical protein
MGAAFAKLASSNPVTSAPTRARLERLLTAQSFLAQAKRAQVAKLSFDMAQMIVMQQVILFQLQRPCGQNCEL